VTTHMSDVRTRAFKLHELLTEPYYCSECAQRLCVAATRLPGVTESSCDLEAGTLTVSYDTAVLSRAELEDGIRVLSTQETTSVAHAAYQLTGLD